MTAPVQQEPISSLEYGTPKGTDLIPGVDVTDFTQAPTGTTKAYLRSDSLNYGLQALGLSTRAACLCATTINLNAVYANGTFGVGATLTGTGGFTILTCDGIVVPLNSRVLVWNQTTTYQNGIYFLSVLGDGLTVNWVLTRATDFNQSANVMQFVTVPIDQGNTYKNSVFQETGYGNPFVIGTTPIIFNLFSLSAVNNVITATNATGTPLSITTTPYDIVSIVITPGTWSITGNVGLIPSIGATSYFGWASSSSATTPDFTQYSQLAVSTGVLSLCGFNVPNVIINVSVDTTIYLQAEAIFVSGTVTGYGTITAIQL